MHDKENKQANWKYAHSKSKEKERSKGTEYFLRRRFIFIPLKKSRKHTEDHKQKNQEQNYRQKTKYANK